MSGGHTLRYSTAIVVIALASFTVWRATSVFSFALAERVTSADNARVRLLSFVDSPEVGARARADILSFEGESAAAGRARQLGQLLSVTPLSSRAWVDLAITRLSTGAGAGKAAEALALSNLTGPNESDVMAARAIFGLPLWSALPSDLRRRLASDLVGGWDSLSAVDRAGLTLAFSVAPQDMRAQLASALRSLGAAGANVQGTLGLASQSSAAAQTASP